MKSKLTAIIIMSIVHMHCFAQLWERPLLNRFVFFRHASVVELNTMYKMKTVPKKCKYSPAGFFGDTEPR